MYKSYKTELNLTDEQKETIEVYFKVCTVAYNRYISFNYERLINKHSLINSLDYLALIKEGHVADVGSELFIKKRFIYAVSYTLSIAYKALCSYVNGRSNFPKNKNIGTKNISIHFSANDISSYYIPCERHRIFIPYIGWTRIKEKGYIPSPSSGKYVLSGWIKKCAGKYFVSALVREKSVANQCKLCSDGIGIDLNINNFAYLSNGLVFENINKSEKVTHLKKQLTRECRKLSRMRDYTVNLSDAEKEEYKKSNYYKQLLKIDKIYYKLDSIRKNYLRNCISNIIKLHPKFIAMEDLKVTSMVQERRFSKYISEEMFYEFRQELMHRCKEEGIEFRIIDKWIPTSKMCHSCGFVRKKLSPDERVYICPSCGAIINRDYNASLNIRDAMDYNIMD